MRWLWTLAIIVVIFVIEAASKLLFVAEVARHGARGPEVVFNFTKRPEDNFKRAFELDAKGERQHYLIGAEIRRRYIENEPLISSRFNNSEVFFRASNIKRTLESAEAQLIGLYPPEE